MTTDTGLKVAGGLSGLAGVGAWLAEWQDLSGTLTWVLALLFVVPAGLLWLMLLGDAAAASRSRE